MTIQEAIETLRANYPDACYEQLREAVDAAIEALKAQDTCEITRTVDDCISRADVEQTVEDNILCYTHSDRPIDQDPDTECHMAIRTAFRMLRKDLRKLPSVQPERKTCGGCKHSGQWEDELEYGASCPCLVCKRRASDNYERSD